FPASVSRCLRLFSFHAAPTAEIYTLSLHDALPILTLTPPPVDPGEAPIHIKVTIIISVGVATKLTFTLSNPADRAELAMKKALRSEEHTSELQSRENLVCRLLLEKKKRRL